MLKIMVKIDHQRRITIPIPYTLIYVSCAIITSRTLWKFIYKITNHNSKHFITHIMPPNRELLFHLVKEFRSYRGLALVDIVADSHEIKITL